MVQETDYYTLPEVAAFLVLFIFAPALILQIFAIPIVAGRVRVIGWLVILIATLIADLSITFLVFWVLPEGYGGNWLYLPIVLVGTCVPWFALPWRHFRASD